MVRVFVAGASGAIGRQLVPLLIAAGHEVTGTTRSPDRTTLIRATGAQSVVVDALDRDRLVEVVAAARPEVVIHQLTDLATPPGAPIGEAELERTARLRREGTANLVAAAVVAGARRLIAQSIGWLYAPGGEPHDEADPLLPADASTPTRRGVYDLERQVTTDPRFAGLVLRYGRLYGEGTSTPTPPDPPTVSVADAGRAAALAVERGAPGIYNIVDDGGPVSNARARLELGWAPVE